jgi:hypothetical protein
LAQTRWEEVSIPLGLTFTIDQIADNGAGAPRFRTTAVHDLAVNDVITISGTTNGLYDGDQTVTAISDTTHFDVGALTFYGLAVVVRGVQGSVAAPHVATTDVFKLVDTTRTLYVDHDAATFKFAVSDSTDISGGDRVTIGNEELLVDAVDTTVGGVAVTRAQNGTVGAVHAAGATVYKSVDTTRILDGGITDVATSITLDDTTGISNGDTIIIEGEQITVTTVLNGTVLSVVVRGANGTTNVAHDTGKAVFKRTAASTTLYIATSAAATELALDTIANLANGDVIVIGAEQITYVTETTTVDGFTVLARGYNSSAAAIHVIATAILKVTDTTDDVGVTTTSGATKIAFSAIAGFAEGDILVIGAERLSVTTKTPAEVGDMLVEGIAISSDVNLVTGEYIAGLELPTDWDAPADVCFQVSRDGTNYLDLMDKDGAIIRVTSIGEGEMRVLTNDNRGADFPLGPNKVRIRSVAIGSSASMKQIDAPVFYLLLSRGK